MIKFFWMIPLALLATSCTVEEPAISEPFEPVKMFASIETVDDSSTKVYADENLKVRWDADDRISIFNKNTYNNQFRFLGETGANSGEFEQVEPAGSGNALANIYSVYPYRAETAMAGEGEMTLQLPSEQIYKADTFGPGANTMVSATTDKFLVFKNLCGYLVLKLYGDNVSVQSIKLEGKHNEPLAGTVQVTAAVGEIPSIASFGTDASTSVTLTCPEPVTLGSTADAPTVFWLVVPPTTFSEGFKITVTDSNGSVFEKSASSALEIKRNTISRMKALEVVPEEVILVTNPYVEKYMEEVQYPETNNPDTDAEYSYSLIKEYPGGGPGEADIAPTHTITWTADASAGALTLRVWEGDWSREWSLPAGTTAQDITNMVPGRRYQYVVTSASKGTVVAEGSFRTTGMLHQVFFEPNGRNGRDLGGYIGLNGKTVAFRKLFRGGKIHRSYTNDIGKANMRAEGIKAEVDLREASDVPSQSPLGSDIAFFAPGFDSGYNHMVRDNPDKVKETFCFVVQCLRENKPVYFHCSAGRDRTATLAILLEGALGVGESDMAKDYELTYFAPEDWSMSTDDDGNPYYGHVRTTYSYKSVRKTIFKQTDSGTYQERIVKYLLQIGVPQQDIDDLRSIMLE